jgi:hypothetical protein
MGKKSYGEPLLPVIGTAIVFNAGYNGLVSPFVEQEGPPQPFGEPQGKKADPTLGFRRHGNGYVVTAEVFFGFAGK